MHRATASFSTLESLSTNTGNPHHHTRMQSRSFPELHDSKCNNNEEGPSKFMKMPTKTPINVR